MGVPLPHLVLPLSGCLSRRSPTRATRGEARGHRSVLAQTPLFMHPSFFLSLDLSSIWCVSARWWTGPNVFALLWAHSCMVSPGGVTLWACGSPMGTQHDGRGSVCCLCIADCVGVDRHRHAHTVAMSGPVAQQVSMVSRPSGHNGPARLCVSIAVAQPTLVTPDGRGGLGG